MNKENGITIIMLIVTLIVMLIIAGVTVSSSILTLEEAKRSKFIQEMTIIQQKVNTEYTKIKNAYKTEEDYGKSIEQSGNLQDTIETILAGKDLTHFRYLDTSDIKKDLDIDNVQQKVLIDFNTREVYSVEGIKYKDKMYYSQYELPGGQKNIEYTGNTMEYPEFEIEKLNYGLYTTLNINNIEYKGNVNGGKLYYGLINSDTGVITTEDGTVTVETQNKVLVDYWQQIANNTVDIKKTGKYAIKLVDKADFQTIKIVEIVLVNQPELGEDLVPITIDKETSKWKKVDQSQIGNWYDYKQKKWANAMRQEDLDIYSENNNANVSIFVWIPRYAYNITKKENIDNISVKFLQEKTNIATDLSNIKISEQTTDYHLPNIFNNKTSEGIWVEKQENIEDEDIALALNYLNESDYGPSEY